MRRSILAVLTGVAALLGLIAGPGTVVARAATVKPAAVSLSCRQQTAGVHQLTMKVGSKTRSYVVYAPAKWSAARKTAVLYILHGQYGQALGTIEGTKTRYQADKDGFLLVAPQGEGGANSNWDYTSGTGVDGSDANFLLQLPALIATNWCIDPARQYIAGYSAGSAVTHVMACYGGFPFAGYAGAAAQNWNSGCTNPKPFDFLYFHGTADPYVPFQGNAQINSVAAAAYGMAALDHCTGGPSATRLGTDVIQYDFTSCAGGVRLRYDILQGGGHVWPGADQNAELGPNTTTISADQVISEFWNLKS